MNKAKEILNKHTKSMNCNSWLKRAPFLEQAILNAINEAINYTCCCEELPNKMVIELSDEEMQIVSTDELIQMEKEAMKFDGFEGWIVKGKAAILK